MKRSYSKAITLRRGRLSRNSGKASYPRKSNITPRKAKQILQRGIKSYKGLKNLNARRTMLGLPNIEQKKHAKQVNLQWNTKSGTIWSHTCDFSNITYGTSSTSRESEKIKVLSKKFRVRIVQPVNEDYKYRVLFIKTLENVNHAPYPQYVFDTTSDPAWQYCGYTNNDQRADNDFKVLYDRLLSVDTRNKSIDPVFKFKVPYHDVYFDDDDSTGATGKYKVYMVIYTDAPNDANHKIQYHNYVNFVDN